MMAAPVALFVYNRPEHTRRMIEALKANQLADKTDLYIFSDGPRRAADRSPVDEVRKYLQTVTGFSRVTIKSAEKNRGLATSIIDGVTEVVDHHGRVIVLEDDLVSSPFFLSYMNEALDLYAADEQVMHVSGYMYPIEQEGLPETFFLRYPSSWSWATWDRAWYWFKKEPETLNRTFKRADIARFNLDDAVDIWEQVIHNLQGKADTWAVFWYASIFARKGLCLYPSRSLIRNIGMDGSGQHCLVSNVYESSLANVRVNHFAQPLEENVVVLDRLRTFFLQHRISRLTRFFKVNLLRLKRYFGGVS